MLMKGFLTFLLVPTILFANPYKLVPSNQDITGVGLITAEVPGQQKIDCVITMKVRTTKPAIVESVGLLAELDPTCIGAHIGVGTMEIRPHSPTAGYMNHFKLFMPSGTDCGSAGKLPFTLDKYGHFVVRTTVGLCTVFLAIPFGTLGIK